MNIGIDYTPALFKNITGIGQYVYQLVHALARIDKENQYVLYPFFYSMFRKEFLKSRQFPQQENFKLLVPKGVPPLLLRILCNPFSPDYLREYFFGDEEILHCTNYATPHFRRKKKKIVTTIYDITVFTHPKCHKKLNVVFVRHYIKKAIKLADRIIAISNYTKEDLVQHMGVRPERIQVVHLATDAGYKPVEDKPLIDRVRQKYRLPEKYILFVGAIEPRKNIQTLIYAYARLHKRYREELGLVIAGAKGWQNKDIYQTVEKLEIDDRVVFPGYIAKEDMSALYSGATVFVYPSLYEGFGLPVLEAMSCGVPVITSNVSSLPEIAGDAARLVCPTDVDELIAVLEEVLDDEELRKQMRQKSIKRASLFSWDRCAKETLKIYESLS